jgi:hypothetical protein
MPKTTVDRHVLLTSEQKTEVAELRAMGLTRSQAWRRVLTPEQRQVFYEQIRTAERLRYIKNPYREIIKRARRLRNCASRRGAKYNAWEFTITEDDLDWPTHCPVLPWIELHYPGHYRHDPAGASLDRINHEKGYVPGNVRIISLRANLLRRDMTYEDCARSPISSSLDPTPQRSRTRRDHFPITLWTPRRTIPLAKCYCNGSMVVRGRFWGWAGFSTIDSTVRCWR